MKKRTLISVFLILSLLFMSSCKQADTKNEGNESVENPVTSKTYFSLMYCYNDSYNPYSANTKMNQELGYLLYDPLIKLDENYKPVNYLADSVTTEGTTVTVTIKNAAFTDGTAVTADDVVYSIRAALSSETKYKTQLEKVVSYSAAGSNTVVINISDNDPYFVNMLDFPIIKKGSDELKDENNLPLPPIGCGRFILDIENECLTANESHYIKVPEIKKITLINTPDTEAMNNNIESGAVSLYYSDLADGETIRMSGQSFNVNLNNLVYLGLNTAKTGAFADVRLRLAVSTAVNRTDIVNDAYYGNAQVANGAFNPKWNDAKSNQNAENTENIDVMLANLNDMGYNDKDNEGYYVNSKGERISFTVLCNEDNTRRKAAAELIVSQLNSHGIRAELVLVDWDDYLNRISTGAYDAYIAEAAIPNNMDISALVSGKITIPIEIPETEEPKDGEEAEGAEESADSDKPQGTETEETEAEDTETVVTAQGTVESFYKGEVSLKDVIAAFNSEMPVIPVCYRTGYVIYKQNIMGEITSTVSDIFYGIENCKFK